MHNNTLEDMEAKAVQNHMAEAFGIVVGWTSVDFVYWRRHAAGSMTRLTREQAVTELAANQRAARLQ